MARLLFNLINVEAFRGERQEWKRFAYILLLTIGLPLFLLFIALEVISWRVGETVPYSIAAQRQVEDPELVWMTDRQQDIASFKLTRLAQERPDVLIMGTSRMSQFRSGMFHPYSFYNLSRASFPISDYVDLLRHFPEGYSPKVIIFSLDFFMFNPAFPKAFADWKPIYYPASFFNQAAFVDHIHALVHVFTELGTHPSILWAGPRDSYYNLPITGLLGHTTSEGFRKDGSEQWPDYFMSKAGRNPHILEEAKWGSRPLFFGDSMGTDEMASLEEFVALAHEKGIALVAVQMPLYGPVARALAQDPHYGTLKDFRARVLNGYLDHLGVTFFDYLDFPGYGNDYRYFQDVHPTEALNAAIVLQMSEDSRFKGLLPKLDTASLQRKLDEDQKATDHVYLYHNDY